MSYCVSRTLLGMRLTMGVCRVLCCVRLSRDITHDTHVVLCKSYNAGNAPDYGRVSCVMLRETHAT